MYRKIGCTTGKRLLELKTRSAPKLQGMGNATKLTKNAESRSDTIYWLEQNNNNEHENAFLDQVDALFFVFKIEVVIPNYRL